jgi:hypothetical protein
LRRIVAFVSWGRMMAMDRLQNWRGTREISPQFPVVVPFSECDLALELQ